MSTRGKPPPDGGPAAERPPALCVVERTDAFERLWPQLAAEANAALRRVDPRQEVPPLGDAAAVLVAAGGAESDGEELVRRSLARGARAVAVAGAEADHRLATRLLRAGAGDYFALPADLELLRGWILDRIEVARAARRAQALAEEGRMAYDFSALVGASPGLRQATDRAARVIPRDHVTVLLTGESGTGKELLARAIHFNGPRAVGPFLEINCTALPSQLLESELFGYEEGAFTDARRAKPGLFEAADGGTLFLDEVGDLALDTQAKLLRVLEDKQVRRLGSIRSVTVDARIICATNMDLRKAVRERRFREDLLFRLNVVPIHLPPLRERGDDLIPLAEHFLDRYSREHAIASPHLGDEIRTAIRGHQWPGNIRELRNAIERALVLGADTGTFNVEDLFLEPGAPAEPEGLLPFPAPLAELERSAARRMLELCGGNKKAAAKALAISRSRFYRLLDRE